MNGASRTPRLAEELPLEVERPTKANRHNLQNDRDDERGRGNDDQRPQRHEPVGRLVLLRRRPGAEHDATDRADQEAADDETEAHRDTVHDLVVDRTGFRLLSPVAVNDASEPVEVAAEDRLVRVEVLVRQRRVDAVPVEVRVGDVVEQPRVESAGGEEVGQGHGDEEHDHVIDQPFEQVPPQTDLPPERLTQFPKLWAMSD